jgi:predicted metal-binding membrane protein
MMESTSKILGGGLLLGAGLFQFSRLKYACLTHCRTPMGFLATEWRDGLGGAFRMGLKHGCYCLGCCWALMVLLFTFGVTNLLWVASISAFVLLEKITSKNQVVSRVGGLVFIGWAGWIVFAS